MFVVMDSLEKTSEKCLHSQLWHACVGARDVHGLDKIYSLRSILDDLVDSDTRTYAYVLSLISSILY
ncbi:hypothetical protein MTR_5g096940 [Medicago truncatula]|uniref:Uncharacterized protein n=1 Tax=Medicago truncatula TaxID=3880 RepID=G7K4V9_MEDTR|nr:hypothetical protein MTR_5g096940 [Medicago truncatula]